MLRHALLGEQAALNKHVPHQTDDREGRAEVLPEAAVLPRRRAYPPPHAVHDILGSIEKNIVQCLVVLDVILVVVVVARVAVDDSSVVVDGVTHLAHPWAVLLAIIDGGDQRSGGSGSTHLVCCVFLLCFFAWVRQIAHEFFFLLCFRMLRLLRFDGIGFFIPCPSDPRVCSAVRNLTSLCASSVQLSCKFRASSVRMQLV